MAPASKPAAEQAIPPRWPLVEIRGFVTQVAALGDFYLGNVHVQTNVGTTFEGETLNDILLGAHLEVHGSLIGGIVNATKVEFDGETELQANVATINSSDNIVTLTGLAGLVIQFDGKTALRGQGNPRRLVDLRSSDHLQIHGRQSGGDSVLAREMERTDPKSNVQVQGLVTSAADPIFVLFGASIDTSLIQESGVKGRYGAIGEVPFQQTLKQQNSCPPWRHSRGYAHMVLGFASRVAV